MTLKSMQLLFGEGETCVIYMKWRGRWHCMKPRKKYFSNLFSTWEKCVSLNCGNFCRTTHMSVDWSLWLKRLFTFFCGTWNPHMWPITDVSRTKFSTLTSEWWTILLAHIRPWVSVEAFLKSNSSDFGIASIDANQYSLLRGSLKFMECEIKVSPQQSGEPRFTLRYVFHKLQNVLYSHSERRENNFKRNSN